MKKALITFFVILAVAAAGYLGWQNREQYFFQGEENFEVNKEIIEDDDSDFDDEDDQQVSKVMTEEEKEEEKEERKLDELDEDEMSLVTASECENECANWNDDEEDFEICQEICGFRDDNDSDGDCEGTEDTEADICFRRKAIDEKDSFLCEKIEDGSLRKNCEDRVLEEILDQQHN